MDIVFSPKEYFPGRGHCIELRGDWVTERVWEAVNRLVNNNFMNSDAYKARQGFCVFFQGGYDNPKGKWILLEFWVDDLEKTNEFMRLLYIAVNDALIRDFTKLRIGSHSMQYNDGKGIYDVLVEIQKETGCSVDWGDSMTPITFMPDSNVQYSQVLNLLHTFEIKPVPWYDLWEKSND